MRKHGAAALPRRSPGAAESSILVVAFALVACVAGCAAVPQKPLPPRVALASVQIGRVSGVDARFTLKLVVSNPNPYDLAVTALDANLTVEGEAIAIAALRAPVVLVAQGDTPIEIEARARLPAIAVVIDRATRQRTVRYEVTGSAVVQNGWNLPFSKTGELPVGDFLGLGR